MTDIVSRRRAREHIETDPAARQRYDDMIALAREVTGSEGDERDVVLAATDLAFDLNPVPPPRLRDSDPHEPMARADGRPDVMWASISFPVATDDMSRRREEVQFIYAIRETMAWMRGGITVPELSKLGLGEAWGVLSEWVDEQRRVTPTYGPEAIAVLQGLVPVRKRPAGHIAVPPYPTAAQVADMERKAHLARRATLEREYLDVLRAQQDWESEEQWDERLSLWGLKKPDD